MSDSAPATAPRLKLTYLYFCALALAAAFTGGASTLPRLAAHALEGFALLLVFAAALGRIWCSVFIAGHKGTALVTSGPYSRCRHPLYALSFIGAIGMAAVTHSALLIAITALTFALLFARAARVEERFLAQAHPAAFAAYARTTPRFWPSGRQRHPLPDAVTLNPAILRKAFWDAAAFLIVYLLLESLRLAREAGHLPTLLRIP